MCGRYTNQASLEEVRRVFHVQQLELFRDWKPTYNVSPSYGPGFEQLIVVGGREAGRSRRVLRLARWWLVPEHWNRPLRELPTAFNARSEDVTRRSLWRGAFARSRCLVPATGWREFKGPPGHKEPYQFHLGGQPFAFAGLHSRWHTPEGNLVETFAILTTDPHPVAARVHHRMPLVLPAELHDRWLDPDEPSPSDVLQAARERVPVLPLETYASDPVGNKPGVEGPEAIAPLAARFVQQDLFGADSAARGSNH